MRLIIWKMKRLATGTAAGAGRLLKVAVLPAAFSLAGCSALFYPQAWFDEVCEKESQYYVKRTVQNVRGFVYGSGEGCSGICRSAIKYDGYDFVEVEMKEADYTAYLLSIVPGPGLYRFEEKPIGHPNCALFEERKAWRSNRPLGTRSPGYSRFQHTCIATTPIKAFTARYRYDNESTRTRTNGSTLSRHVRKVTDRNTGEIIAFSQSLVFSISADRLGPHIWYCRVGAKPEINFREILLVPKGAPAQ